MKQGRSSIFPVIIIVVIIVISVAAIVALARAMFFNKSNTQQTEERDISVQNLLNTNAERSVRMTVRGNITANEDFRSYQITVAPNKRTMTTYRGYLDTPIDSVELDNNTQAYTEFVYALNREGMVNGKALTGERDDTRGVCPEGKILEFETLENDQPNKRLWTTTCKNAKGSLTANSSRLGNLFTGQIPQSRKLLNRINEVN